MIALRSCALAFGITPGPFQVQITISLPGYLSLPKKKGSLFSFSISHLKYFPEYDVCSNSMALFVPMIIVSEI